MLRLWSNVLGDAKEFAAMLKGVLRQLYRALTTPAGFELGTGMFINTAIPEETAAFVRNFSDP